MRSLIVVMTMMLCGAYPADAGAQFIDWQVRSDHPNVVELAMYSQNRPAYSWPGPDRVYLFDDSQLHSIRTSCLVGETLCYGAWVRNREDIYWGTGPRNGQRCSNCCYPCNGVVTPVITLRP